MALVVGEVQALELVPSAVDPVRRLARLVTTEHLGLDRHADVAQQRLVAFECPSLCDGTVGVHARELEADLTQCERHPRLEQQREEVGDPFDRRDRHRQARLCAMTSRTVSTT